MLVDNENDLLVVTKRILDRKGFAVHAFKSPIAALDHVKQNGCRNCSIIISDIRMPDMSGIELVRQVKELNPEIKVVLMTAFKTNKEEAQIVLHPAKVDAFLNKPFRTAELIEAIKQCAKED